MAICVVKEAMVEVLEVGEEEKSIEVEDEISVEEFFKIQDRTGNIIIVDGMVTSLNIVSFDYRKNFMDL